MDTQPAKQLVEFEPVFVLAKPSPSQDFELSSSSGLTPDPFVAQSAHSWLQAHVDAGNKESSMVVRLKTDWWLMRGADENQVDNSGRLMSYLSFGRLSQDENRDVSWLIQTVLGAYQSQIPGRHAKGPSKLELPPLDGSNPNRVCGIVLTLALGIAPFAVADTVGTAAEAARRLGNGFLDYIVLMSRKLPGQFPGRCGIVISRAEWMPPEVVRLAQIELGGCEIPNPAGLLRIPSAPEQKLALLRHAVLGSKPASSYSELEWDWLLETPHGRVEAVRQASPKQFRSWLTDNRITEAYLTARTQWFKEDGPPLARMLSGHSNAASRFGAIMGFDHPSLDELLPSSTAALWRALLQDSERNLTPISKDDVEILRSEGLLAQLPASAMALLESCGIRVGEPWRKVLQSLGLSPEAISAFCEGTPVSAPGPAPDALPESSWVRGICPEFLLRAAAWACKNRAWRHWWIQAVAAHPQIDEHQRISIAAQWSAPLAVWIHSAISDGEMRIEDVLPHVARWRAQPSGLGSEDTIAFLSAGGINLDPVVESLIRQQKPAPPFICSAESLKTLAMLTRHGVIQREQIMEAVLNGGPMEILQAAYGAAVVSFLDPRSIPPMSPPCWDTCLLPLLEQSVHQPGFWDRWPDGIPAAILEWLAEVTQESPAGPLVRVLHDAIYRHRRLQPQELSLLAGGLPAQSRVEQAILWAHDRESNSSDLISQLIAAPILALYRVWLEATLLSTAPVPPLCHLSCEDMDILFPLLDPVRDVLRAVMAQEERSPLEERLLKRVLQSGRFALAIPIAAPNATAAQRRPDWVAAIAQRPGWKHWVGSQAPPLRVGENKS